MKMSNETYNKVKWFVSIFLPGFGALVGALGKAYGWGATDLAVTTIAAITTFLGSVMLYSTSQYNKDGDNDGNQTPN